MLLYEVKEDSSNLATAGWSHHSLTLRLGLALTWGRHYVHIKSLTTTNYNKGIGNPRSCVHVEGKGGGREILCTLGFPNR